MEWIRTSTRILARERGAALVEFSIVLTLLLTLVFGIFEFGLAFQQRMTIASASTGAARVASALGDLDDADMETLESLEASLGSLPNSGHDKIRFVDVFQAGFDGTPLGDCASGDRCNRYVYKDALGCKWTPCPDPDLGYDSWDWAPSSRDVSEPEVDYVGVRITFAHNWAIGGLVPLPNVDCDGTAGAGCWTDATIMRLEPRNSGFKP